MSNLSEYNIEKISLNISNEHNNTDTTILTYNNDNDMKIPMEEIHTITDSQM